MNDRYDEACREIEKIVYGDFGGYPYSQTIADVKRLAQEAMRIGNTGYVREKGKEVISWMEIACSHGKWKPWGLERVQDFTRAAAYKLRNARMDISPDD